MKTIKYAEYIAQNELFLEKCKKFSMKYGKLFVKIKYNTEHLYTVNKKMNDKATYSVLCLDDKNDKELELFVANEKLEKKEWNSKTDFSNNDKEKFYSIYSPLT